MNSRPVTVTGVAASGAVGTLTPSAPREMPLSLVGKLAEVMAAVERIPKRGTNEFHHYAYATEADIVDAVRHELAKRHVMLLPHVRKMTREGTLTTLDMEFVFHDGDSSELLAVQWVGVGEDKSDKGCWKAMTGAVKYCLLKCFLIPTGDDPERDEHQGQLPARQSRKPAPVPPNVNPRTGEILTAQVVLPEPPTAVGQALRNAAAKLHAQSEVRTPPAQAAVDAGQGDMLLVSPNQVKRLWSIARKVGWKDEELKAWLMREYQIDSTRKISRARYDAIMAVIEAGTEAK